MRARRAAPPGASSSAGRVIAGRARGIRLVGPGEATRPLGDRVKETLFAILEPHIRDRPFLDLYAGSGAAGIEALSRGASAAVFVDRDRKAVAAIERNLEATGLAGASARVHAASASAWLERAVRAGDPPRFRVAFMDPPYEHHEELARALERVAGAGPDTVVDSDGVVVAKHFWKASPPGRIGLLGSVREQRFGETMLTFYRWAKPGEGQEDG